MTAPERPATVEGICGRCGAQRRKSHRGYPSPRVAWVYANCDICDWPNVDKRAVPERPADQCVGYHTRLWRACLEWRGLRPCGRCWRHCETRTGGNCRTPCDGQPVKERARA